MIMLYTIGFTKKSAKKFFDLLKKNKVRKIIDTRLKSESQLSGFAKGTDLKYFAKEFFNIDYIHRLDFAPTKEILNSYRKKEITWDEYTIQYLKLLENRKLDGKISFRDLNNSCLLCSEEKPDKCHRKLLAEFIKQKYPDIKIIHLI